MSKGLTVKAGMDAAPNPDAVSAVVERLQTATNAHDLDALATCFAEEYRVEQPVHPARDFTGREQVRRNWEQILGGVPDIRSTLVRSTIDGDVAWCEWDWSGTRRDGVPVQMRGVTIMGIRGGEVAWSRFYMEPVEGDGEPVESVVRRTMMAPGEGGAS